ncbi:hypothetical protein IX95_25915 [Vibrio sp. B183]|uniref:hypothetical protein n=1 Tax=Vibrio sp. B183 TaxID=1526762 RepID=UPI000503329B|nr:hypothetical protein [Vibrio sp. B183]KFI09156.1 hypothetical protein IX95_25915 [Vibrio sp. B183]
MAETIELDEALLTMPAKPAFDGYDQDGHEKTVEVYLLKLLLQDGRIYHHPLMGERAKVEALERKVRAKGQINLEHWYRVRDKQEY